MAIFQPPYQCDKCNRWFLKGLKTCERKHKKEECCHIYDKPSLSDNLREAKRKANERDWPTNGPIYYSYDPFGEPPIPQPILTEIPPGMVLITATGGGSTVRFTVSPIPAETALPSPPIPGESMAPRSPIFGCSCDYCASQRALGREEQRRLQVLLRMKSSMASLAKQVQSFKPPLMNRAEARDRLAARYREPERFSIPHEFELSPWLNEALDNSPSE
jgi:hypothetical protein